MDVKADFWIFGGGQFHRFLFLGHECRWIRFQAALPAWAVGTCVRLTLAQKKALEQAGRTLGWKLRFFTTRQQCLAYASQERFPGYISGLSFPAGYLNPDGILELRRFEVKEFFRPQIQGETGVEKRFPGSLL